MARRGNYRFLGNSHTKEVHDLDNEDTSASGCQINEILRAGHGVTSQPDTLATAHTNGYDNCAKCLSGSKR